MRIFPIVLLFQIVSAPTLAAEWKPFTPEMAQRICEHDQQTCKAFYRGIAIGFFAGAGHSARLAVRDPEGAARVAREASVGEIIFKRLGFCIGAKVHVNRIAEWIKVYAESSRTNSGDRTIAELVAPALTAAYPCR